MKEMKEEEYPELPKWPGMVVVGEKVTERQAAEIILRTDSCYFSTNDKDWDRICEEVLERPRIDKFDMCYSALYDAEEKWRTDLGVLSLAYLNNSMIGSCYILGPHGWCDWDGNIGCSNGNIGKWPNVEDVLGEWKVIAEAFSYLDLRCQLYDKEMEEEGGKPVVEYVVKSGKVDVIGPEGALKPVHWGARSGSMREAAFAFVGMLNRERGCTEDELRLAKDICLSRNCKK